MSIANLIKLPFRYRPWVPAHLKLVVDDLGARRQEEEAGFRDHLDSTLAWLCHAQDVRAGHADDGSVSAGWSFEDGWLPGYPETTGYIIETFFAAARVTGRDEYRARALRMIDWELSLQNADGAFPGHFGEPGSHPVIFNQGQILHGLIAGFLQTGREDCLHAAVRAGEWLVRQQDADGCYRKFEHNGVPHVYNTRAIWPLASIGRIAGRPDLADAARRNLDWALAQQTDSGWYRQNAFVPARDPFTHTIAYAIRGFLESALVLGESPYLVSAERAARGLMARQQADGFIAGTYADGWQPTARYACITGVAQMALCWQRLYHVTGDAQYRDAARLAVGYVKRTQRLSHPAPEVRGGIAGSFPIWGDYSRFEYPNWAAKFFADALIMGETDEVVPPVPPQAVGLPKP
ncbi:MAG: prenyltransferase/squalene oxidase repeat-containing protein [Gammaproteobacteria bacterium]